MKLDLATLWDLLKPSGPGKAQEKAPGKARVKARVKARPKTRAKGPLKGATPGRQGRRDEVRLGGVQIGGVRPGAGRAAGAAGGMQGRYERVTREMLSRYGVRVRRWRGSMSGVAVRVTYQDGTVSRLIESPRPRGPMSAAIFLHEIGHHAIGIGVYRPRCLEEYHAWRFALETMEECGLNVTAAVRERMRLSLRYAVAKAQRRGMKRVPEELLAFFESEAGSAAGPADVSAVDERGLGRGRAR